MNLVLPLLTFGLVFAAIMLVARRSQRAIIQLERHQIAVAPAAAARTRARISIMDSSKASAIGRLATRFAPIRIRTDAARLLLQAGQPMPLGTFLLVRGLFLAAGPLFVVYAFRREGLSVMGVGLMAIGAFVLPALPRTYVKRKARKRARAIELVMPDALDLLVVSVEGGLSLDGGIQQVARRTGGPLAAEFDRLLNELAAGVGRRDAFHGLAARTMSQNLSMLCTTIIQADKMGMSIAATLRQLAETLRTRRRQAAETQARKAPIKMLPFLVFFMLPATFIVILGPVAVGLFNFFRDVNGG